jgi:hypothetical protein
LLVRVALAASFATMLSACGIARTVNGGIYAMPTTGDRIPVGGHVSGQIAFGNTLFVGLDATGRVTGDYMHGALGGHLSFFSQASPGPYGRVGFAPLDGLRKLASAARETPACVSPRKLAEVRKILSKLVRHADEVARKFNSSTPGL